MREIFLSTGAKAQVSDEDFLWLVGFNWTQTEAYAARNVTRSGKSTKRYMHVEIAKRIGLDVSFEIDHIDRNPLNNQRDNLREATHAQNCRNVGPHPKNTTGYRGVYRSKDKFKAVIVVQRVGRYLGLFNTPEEASKAYVQAAEQAFGEFRGSS